MEDLVPFLIFLVIVAINAIKFFAEKGKPKKPAQQPNESPAKKPVSSIESFFERLAERVAPKPTELPDWPEDYERPDYAHEMEEFKQPKAADIQEPPPPPEPSIFRTRESDLPETVQAERQTGHSMLSGTHGLRMPGNTFASTGKAGNVGFRIKNKKNLKRAMLANVVFSPPRALDLSFDPLRQHR